MDELRFVFLFMGLVVFVVIVLIDWLFRNR
ncbi:hypothetical protein Desti_3669 [Desulfomonile tiedjei DSM 6799]|uniref:Uncharacterized protein n=1 Tax=Desulfomonile tiedjei (strain ATCC 49306 / DSM 6799 / DCB-1) TaxID=706587 RepID=I4C9S4_DESTA|nr:hypothetical protein Desti_3669 [Desulfomonile tiedjei DSM 6799]